MLTTKPHAVVADVLGGGGARRASARPLTLARAGGAAEARRPATRCALRISSMVCVTSGSARSPGCACTKASRWPTCSEDDWVHERKLRVLQARGQWAATEEVQTAFASWLVHHESRNSDPGRCKEQHLQGQLCGRRRQLRRLTCQERGVGPSLEGECQLGPCDYATRQRADGRVVAVAPQAATPLGAPPQQHCLHRAQPPAGPVGFGFRV